MPQFSIFKTCAHALNPIIVVVVVVHIDSVITGSMTILLTVVARGCTLPSVMVVALGAQRGCTLDFLNHPFNIDLMHVPLGSFDVIIGMDWLREYHA
nr:reverse transcriptase domain-containing protein [Tanacetum cinerariifolium]